MLMFWTVLVSTFALIVADCSNSTPAWLKTDVVYEIYPRSFQDTDGDGIGDLKGIIQRLEYLYELGIGAIWLSPIYKSPMADFGYDIANFTEIDPIFGTMDDFLELRNKTAELGIKLVLDFVPNHSSDEHEWFIKSKAEEEPYTNYYVWHDPVINNETNATEPPNNWISVFGGSAWEWNEERGQYYLHQFLAKQPDLNYRNETLVEEMIGILNFWMDLGVDGFRVDAIPYLFENKLFPDEPLSGDPNALPNETAYLKHVYTQNQQETYKMVHKWRTLLDDRDNNDFGERVMMLEAYASIIQTMAYYGTKNEPGGHFPFNFMLITDLNATSDAADFNNAIHKWLDNMPEGCQANWVIGNHDNHRVASRFDPELVDGLNMLDLLLPGTAITYYGEEIGMEDTFIPANETVDSSGRDPERTPMQWDNSIFAGFSTNATTWLRVNENYLELNVENQKAAAKSHYKVYKRLVDLRKTDTIQQGNISTYVLSKNIFAFERYLNSDTPSYLVLINLGVDKMRASLPHTHEIVDMRYTVYAASVNSARAPGETVTFPLHMDPKEALVLKMQLISSTDPPTTVIAVETTTKGASAIHAGILLIVITCLTAIFQ